MVEVVNIYRLNDKELEIEETKEGFLGWRLMSDGTKKLCFGFSRYQLDYELTLETLLEMLI